MPHISDPYVKARIHALVVTTILVDLSKAEHSMGAPLFGTFGRYRSRQVISLFYHGIFIWW